MIPSWQNPEVTLAPSPKASDIDNAERFGIKLATSRDDSQWQLVRTPDRLQLCAPQSLAGLAVDLDVLNGPLARRLRGARCDEPLPRACGVQRYQVGLRVVDATAGLCRDAMVLAALGCIVTAIERVPALAFLANDAAAASWFHSKLTVVGGDAMAWMSQVDAAHRPDVVCLDPMFEQQGRAQVKKDMQLCRALVGPPVGEVELLRAALQVARDRVVVKRDPAAAPLAPGVSFAIAGERVRFDVYLTAT